MATVKSSAHRHSVTEAQRWTARSGRGAAPEAEVFNKDSLASLFGNMTNEHPAASQPQKAGKLTPCGPTWRRRYETAIISPCLMMMGRQSTDKDFEVLESASCRWATIYETNLADHADRRDTKNIRILTTLALRSIKAVQVAQELAISGASRKQFNKPNWRSKMTWHKKVW